MADTIEHQGVVENVTGSHLQVRIIQASACAACSIKGHCTSADVKEKLVDVTVTDSSSYRVGDRVCVVGEVSMGALAVLYAFIFPFLVLVISLFAFMSIWKELPSALASLLLLALYYYILWINRSRMSGKFSFSVKPVTN